MTLNDFEPPTERFMAIFFRNFKMIVIGCYIAVLSVLLFLCGVSGVGLRLPYSVSYGTAARYKWIIIIISIIIIRSVVSFCTLVSLYNILDFCSKYFQMALFFYVYFQLF